MKKLKQFLKQLLFIELFYIGVISFFTTFFYLLGDIELNDELFGKLLYNSYVKLWSLHLILILYVLFRVWLEPIEFNYYNKKK